MRSLVLTVVAAVLLAGPAASAAARGWVRPVDGPVLRSFSVGADRFTAGQHRGVDLGAPAGARLLSTCGGRVSFAGRVPRGGRTVSVRCGLLVATYQHLGAVAVRRGQVVTPGTPIGTVGHARPRPHLHLGARDAATGAYLDPLALFAGAPRPVPPPLGPAPAARRPLPLGPAPATRRPLARPPELPATPATRRPLARPPELPATRPAAPPPRAAAQRLPWAVLLGLALVGLGLPLGGFVTVHRRRRALVGRPQTLRPEPRAPITDHRLRRRCPRRSRTLDVAEPHPSVLRPCQPAPASRVSGRTFTGDPLAPVPRTAS